MADAARGRIDVIELVHDRVEFGDPRREVVVELRFPRSLERLFAEARQHERDEVLDASGSEAHFRRFRHEPFGATRQLARHAVAPEILAGFRFRKGETVTRCEGPFSVRTAEPPEDEDFTQIDERKRGRTRDHVSHQKRNALCVIDHRHTPARGSCHTPYERRRRTRYRACRSLLGNGERCDYTDSSGRCQGEQEQ